MRRIFSFPNPVNEKAARVVGGVVLATAFAILATDAYGLLIPLAYGFLARVLTGPTLSPLGWIAQNVIAPALGEKKPVPGPPKRFAQGIGALISTAALVLALVVGDNGVADGLLILPRACGGARVDLRLLRGLQGVRDADARGSGARNGMRGMRRHRRAAVDRTLGLKAEPAR